MAVQQHDAAKAVAQPNVMVPPKLMWCSDTPGHSIGSTSPFCLRSDSTRAVLLDFRAAHGLPSVSGSMSAFRVSTSPSHSACFR